MRTYQRRTNKTIGESEHTRADSRSAFRVQATGCPVSRRFRMGEYPETRIFLRSLLRGLASFALGRAFPSILVVRPVSGVIPLGVLGVRGTRGTRGHSRLVLI